MAAAAFSHGISLSLRRGPWGTPRQKSLALKLFHTQETKAEEEGDGERSENAPGKPPQNRLETKQNTSLHGEQSANSLWSHSGWLAPRVLSLMSVLTPVPGLAVASWKSGQEIFFVLSAGMENPSGSVLEELRLPMSQERQTRSSWHC